MRQFYFNLKKLNLYLVAHFFLSVGVFFHEHSRITAQQGKGEAIILVPLYHFFHPFHRHLSISHAIIAGSSPLHIASNRTRTGNPCFPSADDTHMNDPHIHE